MKRNLRAALTLLAAASILASAQKREVIIDTDPGLDDALALLVALHSPELNILGITVVAGNVALPVGLRNALRLVEAAKRNDVPVAAGAAQPLQRRLVTAENVHGPDGLGGALIPESALRPSKESAVDLILRVAHAKPGQLTIVALGPLTNIALALRADPGIATTIKQIVLMGGALHGGNMTPVAEFNIYVDPEAARAVFMSGVPIVMSPWDASQDVVMTPQIASGIKADRPASLIAKAALAWAASRKRSGMTMYDPVAMAAFIDPTLVTTQKMFVDVETKGEFTAGQTIGYVRAPIRGSVPMQGRKGSEVIATSFKSNADVIVRVDAARFFDLVIERLNR